MHFICTETNDVRVIHKIKRSHEVLNGPEFQFLGTEPCDSIRKEPAMLDQSREGLSGAAGTIVANLFKTIFPRIAALAPPPLQPPHPDTPAGCAFVDEAQRFFTLLSGVGEADVDIIRQRSAVRVQDHPQHERGRAATAERDQRRAFDQIRVRLHSTSPNRKCGQ